MNMERIGTRTSNKKSHKERLKICEQCPNYSKFWKTCKICHCFMPLKTKLRWAECPDEPPRWTQGDEVCQEAKELTALKEADQRRKEKVKRKKV